MDSVLIRRIAKELFGLNCTAAEAEELAIPLDDLSNLVREIERVTLAFSAEPFISPRVADEWLERWPER